MINNYKEDMIIINLEIYYTKLYIKNNIDGDNSQHN